MLAKYTERMSSLRKEVTKTGGVNIEALAIFFLVMEGKKLFYCHLAG